jgi:hypothetical protein
MLQVPLPMLDKPGPEAAMLGLSTFMMVLLRKWNSLAMVLRWTILSTTKAKQTKLGELSRYKAFATHMNPRLDAAAHLGLSLLLYFNVLREPFPNFLDPKDYATSPVYRLAKVYTRGISKSGMYNNWKLVYDTVGIVCSKVTHQPRVNL